MSCEYSQGPTLVLGTYDHEMAAIEKMCLLTRTPFVRAVGSDGNHAPYREAYRASGVSNLELVERLGGTIIPVECCIPGLVDRYVDRFDHHRPGDRGFYGDPSQAWELSSFGQFANSEHFRSTVQPLLREEDRAVGAIDDNPRATLQGLVPHVSPVVAFKVLLQGIAADHNRSIDCVSSEFRRGETEFQQLPTMPDWSGRVRDARNAAGPIPLYNGFDRLLYLAHAYKAGDGVLTHCVERSEPEPDANADIAAVTNLKVTVNGAAPESVADFAVWAGELIDSGEAHGLYLNERRGFGGFYVNPGSDYAARHALNRPHRAHYNLRVA